MKDDRKETLGSAINGYNLVVPRTLRAQESDSLAMVHVSVLCLLDDAEMWTVMEGGEGVGSDKVPCRKKAGVKRVDDEASTDDVRAECRQ